MSKRCPDCGQVNDDSRIFCSACGEPLNSDLRLIQNLEKQKSTPSQSKPSHRSDDDDDYIPPKTAQEKKFSPLPWLLVGAVVLAAVLFFVLK